MTIISLSRPQLANSILSEVTGNWIRPVV